MRTVTVCSYFLLILIFSGCTTLPVVPKKSIPPVPTAQIYTTESRATAWLDCLSSLLANEKGSKIKYTIGSAANTFGTQAEGLRLPSDLKPFIKDAFSRITAGYEEYDSEHLYGTKKLWDHMGNFAGIPENISREVAIGVTADYDILVTGNLYMVQEVKNAELGGEIANLGLFGKVKSYDISAQIEAFYADTGKKVGHEQAKIRLYSAQHGASFFQFTSGDISQANTAFVRVASVNDSLEYLSGYLVAALVRDLSSMVYRHSFASCDQEIQGIDNSRTPVRYIQKETPFRLQVLKREDKICLQVPDELWTRYYKIKNPVVFLEAKQYSSGLSPKNPIHPYYRKKVSFNQLRNIPCLSRHQMYSNARIIEFLLKDPKNRVIAEGVENLVREQ